MPGFSLEASGQAWWSIMDLPTGGHLSRWLLFMIARGAKTVVATSIHPCISICGHILYLAS